MLEYEAKRKPEIAALVARAAELTDEEIETAQVPLPWFRKALREMRTLRANGASNVINYAASWPQIEPFVRHGINPDPPGQLREWMGGDAWVPVGRGNQFQLKDGFLILFPDAGGCWLGSIFVEPYDTRIVTSTRIIGRTTKSGYAQERARRLAQLPEVKEPEGRELMRGVRIYRG